MANRGCSTIDYIVGSPVVWQTATHLEVIIDDTRYCAMGGDSDHRSLPMFKYDKSKAKEYQLALTTNLGNLWVVESIGHLGVDGLADLLQQCVGAVVKSTFGNKLREKAAERDTAINPGLTLTAL